MEKQVYIHPLTEVTKINPSGMILGASTVVPVPPHPVAPRHPGGDNIG